MIRMCGHMCLAVRNSAIAAVLYKINPTELLYFVYTSCNT